MRGIVLLLVTKKSLMSSNLKDSLGPILGAVEFYSECFLDQKGVTIMLI